MLEIQPQSPAKKKSQSLLITELNTPLMSPVERKKKVTFNKRELAKQEAQRRKNLQAKILMKAKPTEEMLLKEEERKTKALNRDLKIRTISEMRRRETWERESEAIREQKRILCSSVEPKRQEKPRELEYISEDLDDVGEMLENLDCKLETSQKRHNEYLKAKISGIYINTINTTRFTECRRRIQQEEHKNWSENIHKIQERNENIRKYKMDKQSEKNSVWAQRRNTETNFESLRRCLLYTSPSPRDS